MGKDRIQDEIRHYLETGKSDPLLWAWEGSNHIERMKRGEAELMTALVEDVRRRTEHAVMPVALKGVNLADLGRRKAEPMVRGLFPKAEQEQVISLLASSVVFLTPENIEAVLSACSFLHSAWTLANLYLVSVDAKPLGEKAPSIVGLSEEQTCYVSPAYFAEEDAYADFIVHEMAHVFHNCKRRTVGLKQTRKREWLLDISFAKREVFAYACEAYSRVRELGRTMSERRHLADRFEGFGVSAKTADDREIVAIVQAACERRNGWKVILEACQ